MIGKITRLFMRKARVNTASVENMSAVVQNDVKQMLPDVLIHRNVDLALQAGDFENAINLYDVAIAENNEQAALHYKRANILNRVGRWAPALVGYDRAIELDPNYANAFCNRGTVLGHLDRWEDALDSYDRAVALNGDDCLAFYNRASALRELGRFEDALDSYERAIEIKSDYAEAYINRGNLLHKLKRFDAAETNYKRAIDLNPGLAEAHVGLGLTFANGRKFKNAMQQFDRAISLQIDYTEAHISRGNALREMQQFEDAISSYDRAIAIDSRFAQAFLGRGIARFLLKRYEAAISDYSRSLALDGDRDFILGMRRMAQMQICEWEGLQADQEAVIEGLQAGRAVCMPFGMLGLFDLPALHRLSAHIWTREECPPNPRLGGIARRSRQKTIKIGYFSADFRNHPVSLLTARLFELHDRSQFEITAFSFGPQSSDPMRQRLERGFDQFIDARALADIEVAELARRIGIDIAVDLGGYTEFCRTTIFALRTAPIQLSYIGYLGTMAAPYMDYLVADATLIPAEQRAHYDEKIIYLPSYQVNHSQRRISERIFTREELGLPPSGFVFSCFNANYKILPEIFLVWMRILKRVLGASLFLYVDNEAAVKNLRREAQRAGVDERRIVFGGRVSVEEYLARYRVMDLFLDTLPYNAGTTASDALWVGVPVVTCIGKAFAGRYGASLLSAMEMPELIAQSLGQYEDLAVELANDPSRLQALRDKLAVKRETAALFDTERFTRSLETAYQQIFGLYLQGLPPQDIIVGTAYFERYKP